MRGRTVPLPPARRLLVDILELSRRIPSVPVERLMRLGELAAARERCAPRPGWPALFLKGYGQVCHATPELRRAYVRLPWPHVVEYPGAAASVAVERSGPDGPAVYFGRVSWPCAHPIPELHRHVRRLAEAPLEEVAEFRRMLRLGRLPGPLRRAALWLGLNLPRTRPGRFGTFALSAYSSLGAEGLHPIGPLTTTLTYGVVSPSGDVRVRLIYDHRVLDGATVARALAALEAELTGPVLREVRGMAA